MIIHYIFLKFYLFSLVFYKQYILVKLNLTFLTLSCIYLKKRFSVCSMLTFIIYLISCTDYTMKICNNLKNITKIKTMCCQEEWFNHLKLHIPFIKSVVMFSLNCKRSLIFLLSLFLSKRLSKGLLSKHQFISVTLSYWVDVNRKTSIKVSANIFN